MKRVSLDTWIQLIGLLGVLGGLIFVGLEMQQNQRIAIAANQQSRAELRAQLLITPFQGNIEMARVLNIEWGDMTEEQKLARGTHQLYRWNTLENMFVQNQLGLVAPETWALMESYIKTRKSECYLRDYMPNFNPAFYEYLRSVPDECAE